MKRAAILAICVAALGQAAQAQTLNACETATDYKIAPLEAGAPANADTLQGVWVGSWEGVGKDGTIQAWYVFGRYPPWQIAQAGKQRWTGKLSDKKMVFKGSRGGADYTLIGSAQLDGLYYNSSGQYKGSFSKK
jgi:hypothetical protein